LSWEDRIPHTVILSNTNSICMEAATRANMSKDRNLRKKSGLCNQVCSLRMRDCSCFSLVQKQMSNRKFVFVVKVVLFVLFIHFFYLKLFINN